MNKNEQLLEIAKDYVEQIAHIDNNVDYHVRYSSNPNDDIANGIRNYYEEVSRILQSA